MYMCAFFFVVLWTLSVVSSSEGLLARQYAPMDVKALPQSCFLLLYHR
jgi:hypothetical protein